VIIPVLYALHGGNILVLNLMVITAEVIIYKHLENIKRIFKGREARISFLWNREGEIERLRESAEE
jgi:glycerol-3-phosphate acyltransferase PlsY